MNDCGVQLRIPYSAFAQREPDVISQSMDFVLKIEALE